MHRVKIISQVFPQILKKKFLSFSHKRKIENFFFFRIYFMKFKISDYLSHYIKLMYLHVCMYLSCIFAV